MLKEGSTELNVIGTGDSLEGSVDTPMYNPYILPLSLHFIKVEGGEQEVYGVLDFGDSHHNPLVYELAITIMYMMTQCRCSYKKFVK